MHGNVITDFDRNLAWARRFLPRLSRALAALPDLSAARVACSMHLDLKMVPLVEGLLARGAGVFLVTCNATTVRDEVVAHLEKRGAKARAHRGMTEAERAASIEEALDWGPTHLCEMGADLSAAFAQRPASSRPLVRAALEATGSGITRLGGLGLPYPVFNWDDLPLKEGLHNRYMVGLTAFHAFFQRTRLTMHGREVLVVGFGLVGRGVADAARAYGGVVSIAERDPARALEAAYAGYRVVPLAAGLSAADVVVTATGAKNVLGNAELPHLRDGSFLINVGHASDEMDVAALRAFPHEEVLPFVEEIKMGDRSVFLFAGGSMANLTAGEGDSLNAFDVTLAVMTSGIAHIVGPGEKAPPGVHPLPRSAWESAAH